MKKSMTRFISSTLAAPILLLLSYGCGANQETKETSSTALATQVVPKDWIDYNASNLLGVWSGYRLANPFNACQVVVGKSKDLDLLFTVKDADGKPIAGFSFDMNEFMNQHKGPSSTYERNRTGGPLKTPFGTALYQVSEYKVVTDNGNLQKVHAKFGSVSLVIFPEVEEVNCVGLQKKAP